MDNAWPFWLRTALILAAAALFFYLLHGHTPLQQPGLEGYIGIHEHNPMLAFPGTSLPDMQLAVDELSISAKAAVLPFRDDPSGILHTETYPVAFLMAIPNTERARRTMLSTRTEQSAETYHKTLLSLIEAYEEALSQAITLLSTGTPTVLSSFMGTSDSAHIAKILREGQNTLTQMKMEEMRRHSCATGGGTACSDRPYWDNVPMYATKSTLTPATPLPDDIVLKRDALRKYASHSGVSMEDVHTFELSDSSCYPSYAPIYYDVSTNRSTLSSATMAHITLLSDVFFYDLEKIRGAFSRALYQAGSPYSYQPFNAYICQDSGEEFGDLLAMRYARNELAAHPITAASNDTKLLDELLAAQKEFLAENPTREVSYRHLMSEAERLLRIKDAKLVELLGSQERVTALRELALSARTRSAGLELVVGYFDDMQAGSYMTARFDAYRTNVFALLRSGISPLLLVANETGPFKKSTSLLSNVSKEELAPTDYSLLSYNRDLRERYTLEKLLSFHLIAREQVIEPIVKDLTARRAALSH